VEIKKEYTTFLVNILIPFMYEGIKSVYNYALETHQTFLERSRHDPSIRSPGVLKIFQTCLSELPALNNHSIEIETNRIREKSKCGEWFDDLVKAVVKSNIVLLTFSTAKNKSPLVEEKYHEKIETKDFIHKCYIECARVIYNNPELFWHEYPTLEIKRNQRETCKMIKGAIMEAIRKMLPMKLILMEYLKNEYTREESDVANHIPKSQYMNIQAMINRDLHGNNVDLLDDGDNMLDRSDNGDDDSRDNGFEEYDENKRYTESENLHNINKKLGDIQRSVGNVDDLEEIQREIQKIESKRASEGSKPDIPPLDTEHGKNFEFPSTKKINKNVNRMLQEIVAEGNTQQPTTQPIVQLTPQPAVVQPVVQNVQENKTEAKNDDDERARFFRNYAK